MADARLTSLTSSTSPAAGDWAYFVPSGGGDRKVTLQDLVYTISNYETGTWTAVVEGSTTAGTYEIASQTSTYTRIGRIVILHSVITMAAAITGGGSGNLLITGMPYNKAAGITCVGSCVLSGLDLNNSAVQINPLYISSTFIQFTQTLDDAAVSNLPIGAIAANDVIRFSVSYEV